MTLHDTPAGTEATVDNGSNSAGSNGANGSSGDDGAAPVRPPSSRGVSMKLAMIVPALGLAILIIFITVEALVPPAGQVAITKTPTILAGGLRGVAGVSSLKSIIVSDEPPNNILNAISVPTGSVVVSHQNNTAAVGQYDAQVMLRVDATQGALRTYYAAAMKKQGWQVFSQGPASHDPGGLQVLGKQAGSDGFYWEMGATVQPTTFPSGAPPTGETNFTIRVFQVPEDS